MARDQRATIRADDRGIDLGRGREPVGLTGAPAHDGDRSVLIGDREPLEIVRVEAGNGGSQAEGELCQLAAGVDVDDDHLAGSRCADVALVGAQPDRSDVADFGRLLSFARARVPHPELGRAVFGDDDPIAELRQREWPAIGDVSEHSGGLLRQHRLDRAGRFPVRSASIGLDREQRGAHRLFGLRPPALVQSCGRHPRRRAPAGPHRLRPPHRRRADPRATSARSPRLRRAARRRAARRLPRGVLACGADVGAHAWPPRSRWSTAASRNARSPCVRRSAPRRPSAVSSRPARYR